MTKPQPPNPAELWLIALVLAPFIAIALASCSAHTSDWRSTPPNGDDRVFARDGA